MSEYNMHKYFTFRHYISKYQNSTNQNIKLVSLSKSLCILTLDHRKMHIVLLVHGVL